MRRCESCGSWTEDCECPIPPWHPALQEEPETTPEDDDGTGMSRDEQEWIG